MSRYEPDWNPKRPQMPVDKDGNWLDYAGYGHVGWETIHQPFYAEFEIDGMRTGRSSKKVILRDLVSGKLYPMFIADLVKGIANGEFTVVQTELGGRIMGWWTGSKRGANYGIKAVLE